MTLERTGYWLMMVLARELIWLPPCQLPCIEMNSKLVFLTQLNVKFFLVPFPNCYNKLQRKDAFINFYPLFSSLFYDLPVNGISLTGEIRIKPVKVDS
jgi:hypothetical protein